MRPEASKRTVVFPEPLGPVSETTPEGTEKLHPENTGASS